MSVFFNHLFPFPILLLHSFLLLEQLPKQALFSLKVFLRVTRHIFYTASRRTILSSLRTSPFSLFPKLINFLFLAVLCLGCPAQTSLVGQVGLPAVAVCDFSLRRLLWLQSTGSRAWGFSSLALWARWLQGGGSIWVEGSSSYGPQAWLLFLYTRVKPVPCIGRQIHANHLPPGRPTFSESASL